MDVTQLHSFTIAERFPTLKRIQKNPSCIKLIEDLGTEVVISEDSIGTIMKFIQTVMYSGEMFRGNFLDPRK